MILLTLVCVIAAYLTGSFPTGYIIVKIVKGADIREIGSGSIGATNVKRVLGGGWYLFVMFFDGFKGLLPVLAAKYIETAFYVFPGTGILPVLVALGVILGHSKSVFLNFTGGKSVASGIGTIMALCPQAGLLTMVFWLIITYFTKIVSVSSMIVVLLTPVWMYVFKQPLSYIVFCVLGAVYIVYLHRDNIKRLGQGTENRVGK